MCQGPGSFYLFKNKSDYFIAGSDHLLHLKRSTYSACSDPMICLIIFIEKATIPRYFGEVSMLLDVKFNFSFIHRPQTDGEIQRINAISFGAV